MSSRTYLSIGDVLTLLREEFPDVTISKIRFLESQGLVNPERSPSGYRKFFDHDVERLRWVLRQQREHFLPLKVIRDRLADGELDEAGAERPNGKPGPAHAAAGRRRRRRSAGAADEGGRGGDGPHPGRRLASRRPHARGRRRPDAGCRWSAEGDDRRAGAAMAAEPGHGARVGRDRAERGPRDAPDRPRRRAADARAARRPAGAGGRDAAAATGPPVPAAAGRRRAAPADRDRRRVRRRARKGAARPAARTPAGGDAGHAAAW